MQVVSEELLAGGIALLHDAGCWAGGQPAEGSLFCQSLELLHKSEAPLQVGCAARSNFSPGSPSYSQSKALHPSALPVQAAADLLVEDSPPEMCDAFADRCDIFLPAAAAKFKHLMDALQRKVRPGNLRVSVRCASGRRDAGVLAGQELSRGQQQEMMAVLTLVTQYTETSASPRTPARVVAHFSSLLGQLQGVLAGSGPLTSWLPEAVQLLARLVGLYVATLRACKVRPCTLCRTPPLRCSGHERSHPLGLQDAATGQRLLEMLVGDDEAWALPASAAAAVMPFSDPFTLHQGSHGLANDLRLGLMNFFSALLSLVESQPPVGAQEGPIQQGNSSLPPK